MSETQNYVSAPPRERKFYRYMAQIIDFTGVGYRIQWGYKPARTITRAHHFIVPYGVPLTLLLQLVYLYTHISEIDFAVVGSIFSIVSVNILVQVAVISTRFKSYKRLMSNLMDEIHLFNMTNGNPAIEQLLINTEKSIRYIASFLFGVLTLDWISWIFVPIYNNIVHIESIRNETMQYQTCIYLWAPFDYKYNFRRWVLIHCVNVYCVWVGCYVIICFTTVSYIFIFLFIGHIRVLKHKIKTYFVGELNDLEVQKRLVDIIKYHAFITELFKDIQRAFGTQIAATYLHNLVGDSLMLYLVMNGSKGNLLIFGFMIVVYMGSMVLISFVLEKVRYESNTLSDAVYALPWEAMTIANQKTLLMMLRRVQPPFVFRAAGGLQTGVRPMLSILKSIFSYYVMLSSSIN